MFASSTDILFKRFHSKRNRRHAAGVIVTDGQKILGCLHYGEKRFWDLPKGKIEKNMTPLETAIRET